MNSLRIHRLYLGQFALSSCQASSKALTTPVCKMLAADTGTLVHIHLLTHQLTLTLIQWSLLTCVQVGHQVVHVTSTNNNSI